MYYAVAAIKARQLLQPQKIPGNAPKHLFILGTIISQQPQIFPPWATPYYTPCMEDRGTRHDVMACPMMCRMAMGCPVGSPIEYPINNEWPMFMARAMGPTMYTPPNWCVYGRIHGMETGHGVSHERHHGHGWFCFTGCAIVHVPWGQPWLTMVYMYTSKYIYICMEAFIFSVGFDPWSKYPGWHRRAPWNISHHGVLHGV